MHSQNLILSCALALGLFVPAAFSAAPKKLPFDLSKSKYQPGQVWIYKTRPEEKDSRLTILAIENYEKFGTIVHISLDNLKIKNPKAPSGFSTSMEHMPVSEKSLDESVVEKEADRPAPAPSAGYKQWKQRFDKGEVGVFTKPVDDLVQFVEGTLATAK